MIAGHLGEVHQSLEKIGEKYAHFDIRIKRHTIVYTCDSSGIASVLPEIAVQKESLLGRSAIVYGKVFL